MHSLALLFTFIWWLVKKWVLIGFFLFLTVALAWWLSLKPSLLRDWDPIDARTPWVTFSGENIVSIENVRNATWSWENDYSLSYISESFNIGELQDIYFVLTPFSDSDGPAHTMLSFSFSWGKNVVISPEIRKERGESFDAIQGVLNQYEIYYLIATEEDVIKLRTNYRNNEVYMYPIRTSEENKRRIFRSMLLRADKLSQEPEFYNTLWNNCALSILHHANALRRNKIWWGIYAILPAHSDEVIYNEWLIYTSLPFREAKDHYRIDEIARSLPVGSDFSRSIRVEKK